MYLLVCHETFQSHGLHVGSNSILASQRQGEPVGILKPGREADSQCPFQHTVQQFAQTCLMGQVVVVRWVG